MSSSYFHCSAYTDVESTVRFEDKVIYIKFDTEKTSVHLTFNPAQIYILAKSLNLVLSKVPVAEITEESNYGNMTVEITVPSEEIADDNDVAKTA